MSWLSDLLQGIPLNSVLRERVALAEQKFKDIETENKTLRERVVALTAENESLKSRLELAEYQAKPPTESPKFQWGCYKFEGDERLYCPACYDARGKKHIATRLNIHRRRCSVCQTEFGT